MQQKIYRHCMHISSEWEYHKCNVIIKCENLPSMRMRKTSLRMVMVVPRTNTEKRKVQMGSATLYSGCVRRWRENRGYWCIKEQNQMVLCKVSNLIRLQMSEETFSTQMLSKVMERIQCPLPFQGNLIWLSKKKPLLFKNWGSVRFLRLLCSIRLHLFDIK